MQKNACLGFSYRFLQTLVDNGASSPKAKYEKLIAFLNENQPLVPFLEAILHPDPCNPQKVDNCAETKDFENWVYCYFELVGKIIVLGNNDNCPCLKGQFIAPNDFISIGGDEGNLFLSEDCFLTLKRRDFEAIVGKINQADGKISLIDKLGNIIDPIELEHQGVFFKGNNKVRHDCVL